MKITFLESFYGGSHKSFLDGLVKYSSHSIHALTLPARFWKWRLRSSALYFAEQYGKEIRSSDLIIATDMLNLAELKALAGYTGPSILFFHENQLTYPLPDHERQDPHLGMVNLASALAADINLFNSAFQLNYFADALRSFINRIPEFVPVFAHERVMKKSQVMYMGCDFSTFKSSRKSRKPNAEPVILWNHRWEFDKQPAVFFNALYQLHAEGIPFKLLILGENYQVHPREFLEAREKLKDRILRFGFVDTWEDYASYLNMADIVVSTAIQENFGFSIAEAMYCKTLPLLPRRLSYPEILAPEFHQEFLYKNEKDLVNKLRHLLTHYRDYDETREKLSQAISRFDWSKRIAEFDELFTRLAQEKASPAAA